MNWQRPHRERDRTLRKQCVAFYQWTRSRGLTLDEAAGPLGIRRSTLWHWNQQWNLNRLQARELGRPVEQPNRTVRNAIIFCLKAVGPWLSVRTLWSVFPGVARRAVADIVRRFRRMIRRRKPTHQQILNWRKPGRVWAMDYAQAPKPMRDRHSHILFVRDLASGVEIAAQPVPDRTTGPVIETLASLFKKHGAPLVLKSDNEGSFRDVKTLGILRKQGVTNLLSPPYWPRYNGAREGGIKALKWWSRANAWWTGKSAVTYEDIEMARHFNNVWTRPWGAKGPSRGERWANRKNITPDERRRFLDAVDSRREELEKTDDEDGTRASKDRLATTRALQAIGYLEVGRRRITLPIKSRPCPNIS